MTKILLIAIWFNQETYAQFAGGAGTPEDPWQVETLEQLMTIDSHLSSHFILISDIDASATETINEGQGFASIGSSAPFTGSFDGNGYAITNLHINRPGSSRTGLFGEAGSGSEIVNIRIENAFVVGERHSGILVGLLNGGRILDSSSSGSIDAQDNVGGLVGYMEEGGEIIRSFSTANVSASDQRAGGLIGYNNASLVIESFATGNVSGPEHIGGLAGFLRFGGVIQDSYATGDVSGTVRRIGGLIGRMRDDNSTVISSFSAGSVQGPDVIGGLVGDNNHFGPIHDCYWDVQASGLTQAGNNVAEGAIGLLTSQMNGQRPFFNMQGLDFEDIWLLTDLYPALHWEDVEALPIPDDDENGNGDPEPLHPAFPGAEGFGKFAQGGRGGDVYYVTNLNDSGPGSLREGIQTASGPRTILFAVSGTIALESRLAINRSFITIAGQSAPGDGITLKNYELRVNADHVIIRFIRSRLGDQADGSTMDAIRVHRGSNIILDHCSASWSVDETLSSSDGQVDLLTVQWCMVTESMDDSIHPEGPHGMGGVLRADRQSYHHNLFAHHHSRTPKIGWRSYMQVDFRNNVIYNWGGNNNYDGSSAHANWTKNFYRPGPATRPNVENQIFRVDNKEEGRISFGIEETAQFYIEENHMEGNRIISENNWLGVRYGGEPGYNEGNVRVHEPFDYPAISYEKTALEAYEAVLRHAGASLVRDAVDIRVIEETASGTATYGTNNRYGVGPHGIIDSQNDVGGWPELRSLEPPADTDGDGMPDWWEIEHGLDPEDPADGNLDRNEDGYTNLEEYLDWIVNPAGRFMDRHPGVAHEVPFYPLQVLGTYPENFESGITLQPELSWKMDHFSSGYALQVFDRFNAMILDTLVGSNSLPLPVALQPEQNYYWKVRGINDHGEGSWSLVYQFTTRLPTDIEEYSDIPDAISLQQNYPNPFNPVTVIRYQLKEQAFADLRVYDVTGREVAVLVSKLQVPGYHHEVFQTTSLASGVYFYRLRVSADKTSKPIFEQTRAMTVIR